MLMVVGVYAIIYNHNGANCPGSTACVAGDASGLNGGSGGGGNDGGVIGT